ncbi:MAG: YheC/YheD family protein [Candidatus Paceibacterota bacterium]|jgi:glutathione synthase/RimK-type ligase-like ATP-grasp enzyme
MNTKETVGIIVHKYENPNIFSVPYGEQNNFFNELLIEAKKINLELFIFQPKDINWKKKTIKTFVNINNNFIEKEMPLPDIVYDRMFSKTAQEIEIFKEVHKKFNQLNILIVNSRKFIKLTCNKWEFYQLLYKNKFFRPYLPKTFLYEINIAKHLLKKCRAVILKPKYGGLGTGIISVIKKNFILPIYIIEYQTKNNSIHKKYKKFNISLKTISSLIEKGWKRGGGYIVQEKLTVAQYQKRVFDLRVMMQKTKKGWSVSGIGGRVAPLKGFLANIHAGGTIENGVDIIKNVFPKKSTIILRKIKKLSVALASYLEKSTGPAIEMGVDCILDKRGNIWIIEVNSKPSRFIFSRKDMLHLRKKMILRPLLYMKWLIEN